MREAVAAGVPATRASATAAMPVRMYRSAAAAAGGPTVADVHPDELDQYRAAGFTLDPVETSRGASAQKE